MRTEKNSIYKCSVCMVITETVRWWGWILMCCGQPMQLLEEKSWDEWLEKHVPIIKKTNSWVRIVVWEVEHPMTTGHYIERIEIITKDNKILRKSLSPSEKPEAEFNITEDEIKTVRWFCNLHDLWKN